MPSCVSKRKGTSGDGYENECRRNARNGMISMTVIIILMLNPRLLLETLLLCWLDGVGMDFEIPTEPNLEY